MLERSEGGGDLGVRTRTEETSQEAREEVQEAGLRRRFLRAKLGPRSGDAGKVFVPAEGSGAGGSAWCSVPEEERTGTGKNPRRNSATPSTSITTQHAAKVPEPSRIVPTRRAGILAPVGHSLQRHLLPALRKSLRANAN